MELGVYRSGGTRNKRYTELGVFIAIWMQCTESSVISPVLKVKFGTTCTSSKTIIIMYLHFLSEMLNVLIPSYLLELKT